MATQQQRIIDLAQAIGRDINGIKAAQTQASIRADQLEESIANVSSIDDSATSTSTSWSSSKTASTISDEIAKLVGGSGEMLDTLKELADAIDNDPNYAKVIAEQMGYRVRVDAAQAFTVEQQRQGCQNLGIGNPDTDFVAVYNTAKA